MKATKIKSSKSYQIFMSLIVIHFLGVPSSFHLKIQSRAFLNVIFERFDRIIAKICLQRNIFHFNHWEKAMHRAVTWHRNADLNFLAFKFGIKYFSPNFPSQADQ